MNKARYGLPQNMNTGQPKNDFMLHEMHQKMHHKIKKSLEKSRHKKSG